MAEEDNAGGPTDHTAPELRRKRLADLPSATQELRIPLAAYSYADAAKTTALHDHRYMREMDRQAAIYSLCLHDAVSAALRNDTNSCWRHLQGALFAGIIVTRLVDPGPARARPGKTAAEATEMALARAERLRTRVGLPGPNDGNVFELYKLRDFRDAMEHVDERLDHISQATDGSVSDWYLATGAIMVRNDAHESPIGFRAFDPTAGRLIIDGRSVSLFDIDLNMYRLRIKICDELTRIESGLTGRPLYGNTKLQRYADVDRRLGALKSWEKERADLQNALTRAQLEFAARPQRPVLEVWAEVTKPDGGQLA